MTEDEIRDKAKQDHATLSASYYAGTSGLAKEQFDIQHGQVWADMEAKLIAGGYWRIPEPPRDLAQEIDLLKAEIEILKAK